jgi:protocatechuate 3,4-dioxygenase beta subunit
MNGFQRLPSTHATLAETLVALRSLEQQAPSRRRWLAAAGGAAGLAALSSGRAIAGCVDAIPDETGGPFPADGTNGPNALATSGVVRRDMRGNFGPAGSSLSKGTDLSITLQLVNTNDNCKPLAGFVIYVWHCDARGRYSLYSNGVTSQNFMRGVQVADSEGKVTFLTIFPGAYPGRWPHMHFEIFESISAALNGRNAIKTSQLAFDDATCRRVFAQTDLYPGSLASHNRTPLASDGIFSGSANLQMTTTSGTLADLKSSLQIGVSVSRR